MTQEFIHADDPDWVPEEETAEASETEEEAQELTEEEIPAEETEDAQEAAEEVPADVTEETEEEQAEEGTASITVKVTASMRSENLMHLKAVIEDPEGNDYNYQWQVSVDGGENYEDVEDAEEDFFDVELDEENVTNLWRVRVHAI
jgi:hypothetical protein